MACLYERRPGRTRASAAGRACAAGDQRPGTAPADVVFVIKEKPHAVFRREKDDLVCTLRVPLVDALCDGRRALTTLDGRELRVPASGAASAPAEWVVAGEGMPISKVRGGRARPRAEVLSACSLTPRGRAGARQEGRPAGALRGGVAKGAQRRAEGDAAARPAAGLTGARLCATRLPGRRAGRRFARHRMSARMLWYERRACV